MEFPAPAVLFWVWFILTPAIRFLLWMFGRNLGRFPRLLLAHGAAYIIIVAATAIALSGSETAGMALMFAVGQAIFFIIDFWRLGTSHPDA